MTDERGPLVHRPAHPPQHRASTSWSCNLLGLKGRCSLRTPPPPQPREVSPTNTNHPTVQKGAKHRYMRFSFCFLPLKKRSGTTPTVHLASPSPAPSFPKPVPLFPLRTVEGRERGNKIEKKKCRITFGHVSPRTLCAQVAIEKLPLRKRAAPVTINPTSSIPSLPSFARMVRRASCLLIFLSCLSAFPPVLSSLSPPLYCSLSPSLLRCLSLSFALIRSRAGCARSRSESTWLCQLRAFSRLIYALRFRGRSPHSPSWPLAARAPSHAASVALVPPRF